MKARIPSPQMSAATPLFVVGRTTHRSACMSDAVAIVGDRASACSRYYAEFRPGPNWMIQALLAGIVLIAADGGRDVWVRGSERMEKALGVTGAKTVFISRRDLKLQRPNPRIVTGDALADPLDGGKGAIRVYGEPVEIRRGDVELHPAAAEAAMFALV